MKRTHYAAIAFFTSIIVGVVGIFLPPLGVIDNSILIWTAQLLAFVASVLGIKLPTKSQNND